MKCCLLAIRPHHPNPSNFSSTLPSYRTNPIRDQRPIPSRPKTHIYPSPLATMEATDYPVINVLFALHPGMDALDFIGPLEVLTHAQHNKDDECKSIAPSLINISLSSHSICISLLDCSPISIYLLTAAHLSYQSIRAHFRSQHRAYPLRPGGQFPCPYELQRSTLPPR